MCRAAELGAANEAEAADGSRIQSKTMVEEKKLTVPVSDVTDVEMKRQLKWVDWSLRKINKFVKKSSGEPLVPLTSLLPISQPLPSKLTV